MNYVDRAKFVKVFNQTREKYQLSTNQVARKCNLSSSELYKIISSSQSRINTRIVKQIGFGLKLNPDEIHYWIMKMGIVYHHATPHKNNRSSSSKHRQKLHTHHDNSGHSKIKSTFSQHRTKSPHGVRWLLTIGIIIIILMAGNSCLSIYRHHENTEQNISQAIQKNNQKNGVYNAKSLQKTSNQSIAKEMVAEKQRQDHNFAKAITYNPKNNVATVYFNKPTANKFNYAATNHKKNNEQNSTREKLAIKKGIQIDNRLTNQAIQIANRSHDGYFTFKFANAKQYEGPDTAASK